MAFYARRSLATALCRPFSRRLHPAVSHLLPPYHDCSDKPSTSSSPVPPQTQSTPLPSTLPRPSRSQASSLPFPFALYLAAHRNFSTASSSSVPDIDVAAEVLTDAASSSSVSELLSEEVVAAASSVSVPPAPYAGEVASAAAESFPPVAALQHLMNLVHSFTGLNWWACIALTTVMIRLATIPLLVNQMKSTVKLNSLRPEIEAIKEEMQNSTDPRSLEMGKQKMGALFLRHGVYIHSRAYIYELFLCCGGAYWFSDLTTPDDLLILPVLTSLAFLATVEAIFFYWVTSNLLSLDYGVVIRKAAIRNYLDLPPLESQQPTPPEMQSFNLFSGPKSVSGVDSPRECERSSSALSHRIKELEDRTKSRGESQE